jgi:uncharacterized damage-inducible protein DinB
MRIAPDYLRDMARYACWQSRCQIEAAGTLTGAQRNEDRGAFFGSIAATLSHLLWSDRIWLSRIAGTPSPGGGIAQSATMFADWTAFRPARVETDAQILEWTETVTPADLEGNLTWHSAARGGRDVTRPRALCIMHFFNHQTHHRGQVHAMLTAAGAKPDETDLVFVPGYD